jgi:hypothetical protein
MRRRISLLLVLSVLALSGCFAETRDWMKIDQRYTKEEFQRDYRACERGREVDEPCMRERGWVPVNPAKSEAGPKDPLTPQRSRGRY